MQTIETVEDVLSFLREEVARYRDEAARWDVQVDDRELRLGRRDKSMKANAIEHAISIIERRRKEGTCKSTS